jgi:hypothetical protein
MSPLYTKASEELNSLAHFASVDVDADKHLTALEHVAVVPTLKLFRYADLIIIILVTLCRTLC